jgi:hypothetical protein
MNKFIIASLAALAFIALPGGNAEAATYYPNYNYQPTYQSYGASTQTQIAFLMKEITRLQAELARINNTQTTGPCYMAGNIQYCYHTQYPNGYNNYGGSDRARSIDVDYRNNAAYIEIEYTDGDDEDFVVAADDNDDVIDYILDLTDLPLDNIRAVIDFSDDNDNDNDEDVEDIDVEIDRDDNEAEAEVRYEDGDRDTFDFNTDDKDEIIKELADELDMDEDDVEDLIDWSYNDSNDDNDHEDIDDIDSIEVEFDNDDAEVRVEWEDGEVDTYTYSNVDEDEDEVIEMLSDDLDIDEDDIEDIIEFDYN